MKNDCPIRNTDGGLPSAVDWSHRLIEGRLKAGDVAVDATAGNGHDTLFLVSQVCPGGHVFAFDIQEQAITATRARLLAAGMPADAFTLIFGGHEQLTEKLPVTLKGCVRTIMFNLGYLPGSDKSVITETTRTMRAVESAIDWMSPGGLMTVVVYPGHEGGAHEARELERWASQLPTREIEVQHIRPINRSTAPPECWVFWKRG